MSSVKEQLSGVFVPMVTPFENDELLLDGVKSNVEQMNDTGLRGYFVLGTNGEYKSLGTEERYRVLETVAKNAAPDKVVMAGAGAESSHESIYLVKRAVDSGAQMVSLLMPHFFAKKIDAATMIDYIWQVADESSVPVLVYNNPSVAAGITVTAEVIEGVKDHPKVVGIKDSSKDTWRDNLAAGGEDLLAMAGSANYFLDLLSAGGVGGVLSLANIIPQACSELYSLYIGGKKEEAAALNERLVSLNKLVSGKYGVAGVKYAMDYAGFSGGTPRRPLKGLTDEQKKSLEADLSASGFFR